MFQYYRETKKEILQLEKRMETAIVTIINENYKLGFTFRSQIKLSSHFSIHIIQAAIIHSLVFVTGFSYCQRYGRVILSTETEYFNFPH